jgi:hypothetical protein
VVEWLIRRIANPLPSGRAGSNPVIVEIFFDADYFYSLGGSQSLVDVAVFFLLGVDF